MKPERRSHHRVKPRNIKADVSNAHPSNQEVDLKGEILDVSRTGIRIKLSHPLDTSVHDKLKITMILPESGAPFTIHGTLKHQHSDTEYGMVYTTLIT